MSEPFLGQIMPIGFNFPVRGWALCDGATLPISQNSALFSLLGTTFGGDGRTTFSLPDLRSRSMVHVGTGPGLDTVDWGETGGDHETTLTTANMPAHNHTGTMRGNSGAGNASSPENNVPAVAQDANRNPLNTYATGAGNVDMSASTVTINNTGSGVAFNIRNPYLGIYHQIALQGVFPSRS